MEASISFGPKKMLNLGENDEFIERKIKSKAENPRTPHETVLQSVYETHVSGDQSMEAKYKKVNENRVRIKEQSGKNYTCIVEGIGATGGKRIMTITTSASSPELAAKKCLLSVRDLNYPPEEYSLDELQGKFGSGDRGWYVLAVVSGHPKVPLKMTPHGLS